MSNMAFVKGMGLGLVVGSVVGMSMPPKKKHGKNAVGRAIRTIGEVIENISDAVGL